MKNNIVAGVACLLGVAVSSMAGTVVSEEFAPEVSNRSICDVFDMVEFYKNPDGAFLQSIAFTGRLQVDGALFDEDDLGDYDALLFRRVRAGFKAKFLNDFTLHSEADFDFSNGSSPRYNRLTDSYIAWSPNSAFKLKVGKQSAGFTLDGATSSKKLITIDRSNLANNLWFPSEYHLGVSVGGEVGGWSYGAGFYSADGQPEFGDQDSGRFGVLSLGRDISDTVGLDKASVRVDYVKHEADLNNFGKGTRNLEQVLSLVTKWENGNWGLWTDVSHADGIGSRGQGDLFGVQIMPFYNFSEKVQGVFRYTYLDSDMDNGIRLARYENRITGGRGDELHEFYLGLNYYMCDHKLKWQTAVQYTTMDDSANDGGEYDGWGLTSGLRISW